MRKLSSLVAASAATLLASVAWAAPKPETRWGLPTDVSQDGHLIDTLLKNSTAAITVLFVIMVVWMAIACLKHNSKHQAVYDTGDHARGKGMALGIAFGVFFFVDGYLFINSTKDLHDIFHNFKKVEEDPRTVRVQVNAHQWAWDFRYAGPDRKFNTQDDIVTLNDMRVPVGAPVLLQIAAADVIHAFYVPNFRVKIDAVPGTVNRLWFQAKEAGEFDIGCAQHCGTNHYKMKGQLTVLPQAEYEAWAAQASANSARAYDPADKGAHWGWEWKQKD